MTTGGRSVGDRPEAERCPSCIADGVECRKGPKAMQIITFPGDVVRCIEMPADDE